MFILANLVEAVAHILLVILNILFWCIVARAIISWVNPDPYNVIVQMLHKITDPILYPIRKLIPTHNIGIDLSPMIAIIGIMFLKIFLIQSLFQMAAALR